VDSLKKGIFSKFGLVAVMTASVLTISATTATGEASRIAYFSVPANGYCGNGFVSQFTFNVSNASSVPTDVTVYFYDEAGAPVTTPSTNSPSQNISGSITPGTVFTIPAKATKTYHMGFGTTVSCGERPFQGKVVVESDAGMVMANGWITSRKELVDAPQLLSSGDVIVNEGKPF